VIVEKLKTDSFMRPEGNRKALKGIIGSKGSGGLKSEASTWGWPDPRRGARGGVEGLVQEYSEGLATRTGVDLYGGMRRASRGEGDLQNRSGALRGKSTSSSRPGSE